MKKILLVIVIAMSTLNVSAQEIFNEVKRLKAKVEALMNDTTKNIEVRKVACFKNDALYYMIDKAGNTPGFSEYELGCQANAMIDFVNLYVKRIAQEKKKTEKELIKAKYKNATIQNALFNDMEKEVIYGYVDNEDFITQFSLDTDWVKALEDVRK
ncbi:MAG: hypothetical protein ACI350_05265 [Prevotella sp.]